MSCGGEGNRRIWRCTGNASLTLVVYIHLWAEDREDEHPPTLLVGYGAVLLYLTLPHRGVGRLRGAY